MESRGRRYVWRGGLGGCRPESLLFMDGAIDVRLSFREILGTDPALPLLFAASSKSILVLAGVPIHKETRRSSSKSSAASDGRTEFSRSSEIDAESDGRDAVDAIVGAVFLGSTETLSRASFCDEGDSGFNESVTFVPPFFAPHDLRFFIILPLIVFGGRGIDDLVLFDLGDKVSSRLSKGSEIID